MPKDTHRSATTDYTPLELPEQVTVAVAELAGAAYGSNYQRLQQAKADYDPDNLFRVNRNIPPAGIESSR